MVNVVQDPSSSEPERQRRSEAANARATLRARLLDWGRQASDIPLHPHSPLAIADVLSHTEGVLKLVPFEARHDPATMGTDRPSADCRLAERHRRPPRASANLLVDLDTPTLNAAVRRLQVEAALNTRSDQTLVLAAGFLKGPDNNHAPLLLFPVTLMHEDDLPAAASTRHNSHLAVLRRHGDAIENTTLRAKLRNETGIDWAPFNGADSLQDWLSDVAAAMAELADHTLVFDIALGRASRPLDEPPHWPHRPLHFDSTLARQISETMAPDALHQALQSLLGNAPPDNAASHLEQRQDEQLAVDIHASGFGATPFRDLIKLPNWLRQQADSIECVLGGPLLTDVLADRRLSAVQLWRLGRVVELIDQAPESLEQQAHPDLAFAHTLELFRRARHQAQLVEEELRHLASIFLLDRVPPRNELLNLIDVLARSLQSPQLIGSAYMEARRRFLEFSVERPARLGAEQHQQLDRLARIVRFRELYVNNGDYRQSLGPAFRGFRTDWERLEKLVQYSQRLSHGLGSPRLAARALSRWGRFRAALASEFKAVYQAATALEGLSARALPFDLDARPRVLIEQLRNRAAELEKLLDAEHPSSTHTAAALRRLARQHPCADEVMAELRSRRDQDRDQRSRIESVEATIDMHVSRHEVDPKSVMATLDWLQQAATLASELELDSDALLAEIQ